jgi:hypothetical protein
MHRVIVSDGVYLSCRWHGVHAAEGQVWLQPLGDSFYCARNVKDVLAGRAYVASANRQRSRYPLLEGTAYGPGA